MTFTSKGVSICDQPAFVQAEDARDTQIAPQQNDASSETEQWSEMELAVREVIAKIAKISPEEVTKSSRLVDLGVDSISAIKLSSLLRGKGFFKLGVSDIIKAGSVNGIVAARQSQTPHEQLTNGQSESAVDGVVRKKGFKADDYGLSEDDVEKILPATAGQVYLLNTWLASKGEIFYPEFKYRLMGASTIDKLQDAWNALLEKHAILRTTFVATSDADMPFLQLVLKSSNSQVITDRDHVIAEQPLAHLIAEQSDNGLNVGLKIHHALYDAVSLPLLMNNLERLLRDTEVKVPQIEYSDYLSLSVSEQAISQQRDFWTSYLKDCQTPQLVMSSSPNHRRIEAFDPTSLILPPHSESALRKRGVNIQSLFFASYAKWYANSTSAESDIVLGIYLANRSHMDDLSFLAAPTLNVVPLRVRQPSTTNLVDVAKQVQNDLQIISTAPNAQVGLWQVDQWTGVKVDTFVNFLKLPDSSSEEEGEKAVTSNGQAEDVSIEEVESGRQTEARYNVHEPASVREEFSPPKELQQNRVAGSYLVSPSYPLKSCKRLVTGEERRRLTFAQPSLDIEATVKDGMLAVGVFGYERMCSIDVAKGIIGDVAREIGGFFEA